MNSVAIVLILISAVTHASWNLLGKREHPTAAFFLVANTVGAIALTPALIAYGAAIRLFPPAIWLFVAATGFGVAFYYVSLAGAYRHGHMSVAYPLVRAMPVVLVAVVTYMLGRGGQLSTQCVVGMGFVVGGCLILPMKTFGDVRLSNYLNPACLCALGAALGVASCSLLDDEALRRLRGVEGMPLSSWQIALLYCFFEAWTASAWLALLAAGRRATRAELPRVLRNRARQAASAGVGVYLAYGLVLMSMAFVVNVSYVVAFRQLSVPIGTVLGVWILKEPRHAPKFLGVLVMLAGFVLVATG